MELFARRELGLSRRDLLEMTDGELALAIRAWEYEEGRRRYVEQYCARYSAWEREQRT